MATFKHSGDLGDIVYSLPAIRALGGGVLYLDTTGGADEPICRAQLVDGRTEFGQAGFDFIAPLLRAQRGIEAVDVWKGEAVDYVPTPDALQMARVIAGCETFIANATFGLALAIGLGHASIVHEFEPRFPTTHSEGRRNITYV